MDADHRVTRLSTTPVKGLALHHPDAIELTPDGAVGDRVFFLVDDDGEVQSCTANRGLFGLTPTYDSDSRHLAITRGQEVVIEGVVEPGPAVTVDLWGVRTVDAETVADPAWSAFFSDLVGKPVRFLRARGSAYDVWPVTLVGTASLDELARHGADGVDPRRFRMLIEFSGGDPHVEDSWAGRLLEVGGAVVRAGGRVKRCAATTRHPDSGEVDLQTLRLITSYRGRQESEFGLGAHFGVYGEVVEPGRVSVGDRLTPARDA